MSAFVLEQTLVLNPRLSFRKCWYFNQYLQNFVEVVRNTKSKIHRFSRDLPSQSIQISHRMKAQTKPIRFRLCLSWRCLKMLNYFQKSWNFMEFRWFLILQFEWITKKGTSKNELFNVADCSTSSRRKPGWRFTAGSTYRTAVFLKRPAPAKIYDVGREYFDFDTLLFSYWFRYIQSL